MEKNPKKNSKKKFEKFPPEKYVQAAGTHQFTQGQMPGRPGPATDREKFKLRGGRHHICNAQYRFLEAVGVSGRLPAEIWATGKICS